MLYSWVYHLFTYGHGFSKLWKNTALGIDWIIIGNPLNLGYNSWCHDMAGIKRCWHQLNSSFLRWEPGETNPLPYWCPCKVCTYSFEFCLFWSRLIYMFIPIIGHTSSLQDVRHFEMRISPNNHSWMSSNQKNGTNMGIPAWHNL